MCDYICCEDGNCNNNTVSDIRRKLDPSIEILPVLPPVEIVAEGNFKIVFFFANNHFL